MLNIKNLFVSAAIALAVMFVSEAHSATLGTSDIIFNASGSPNSIGGSWNASTLTIADEATIEFFTVELTSLVSPFGPVSSIAFRGSVIPSQVRTIAFCLNVISCVANSVVGEIGTVADPSSTGFRLNEWEFLMRLVAGSGLNVGSGNVTVSYRSGGDNTSMMGTVLVTAHGVLSPVPLPTALPLFGTGLGIMGFIGWRRKRRMAAEAAA